MNHNDNNQKRPKVDKLYLLGIPKRSKHGNQDIYGIGRKAILGVNYFFICPVCKHTVRVNLTQQGVQRVSCKNCQTFIYVKGVDIKDVSGPIDEYPKASDPHLAETNKTQDNNPRKDTPQADGNLRNITPPFASRHKIYNAKVCWGGLLHKKQYALRFGENWIGRKDMELPSDINVKDRYMSRRSVCIEVTEDKGIHTFKMTVYHASNPVTYCGIELEVGQSVFLNYDDVFQLGDTVFTIKKIASKTVES